MPTPTPPGVPPGTDPTESHVEVMTDGSQVWVDAWLTGTRIEQTFRVVRTENRPIPLPPTEGTTTTVRMCQQYEIRQPQEREVKIYALLKYKAEKTRSGWWYLGAGLVIVGSIVVVVATGGMALAAYGAAAGTTALAAAGTATVGTVSAVALVTGGGIAVTVGSGIVSIAPADDYERASFIGGSGVQVEGPWADKGNTFELSVGSPFPC